MTPAEFHFITGLTDVAKNMTLRNATANATLNTIMAADISELNMPTFWIQLGLIPVPGIIACYVVGKVVDYLRGPPPTDRQPVLVTDNSTDLSNQHTRPSTQQEEEKDDRRVGVPSQRKTNSRQQNEENDGFADLLQRQKRFSQQKEEDDDSDVVLPQRKARSHQPKAEDEDPIGVQSQRTKRFRHQIDRIHRSAEHLREQNIQSLRRPQSKSGSVQPRGTVESGHLAGADAKEKKVKEDRLRALGIMSESESSEFDRLETEDEKWELRK